MKHVLLLGDSVFDNAAYVGSGEPDVTRQVQDLLTGRARATLRARDGAVLEEVAMQLNKLPPDTSHLVISAGGNDALGVASVLDETAASVAGVMERLARIADSFGEAYGKMLRNALMQALPTAVCTIYEPRFTESARRKVAATALTLLNDHITRAAFATGVTLIDLRLICGEDEDFANPIEPSARGGAKIAHAIAAFAEGASPSAWVFAGSLT
jgi:hypothetical protein